MWNQLLRLHGTTDRQRHEPRLPLQRRAWRRGSHAACAVVPERLRPHADDFRPAAPSSAAACPTSPPTAGGNIDLQSCPTARHDRAPRPDGGTSRRDAAAGPRSPSQLERDLPRPGPAATSATCNDLLYIAAVIAPASFNDVTLGTNISLLHRWAARFTSNGRPALTPTGYGYHGRPGLRPGDRAGHAQRPAAGARARRRSPIQQMFFGTTPRRDQCRRPWRLDQRRRPEPLVPDACPTPPRRSASMIGPDAFGFFSARAPDSFAWTSQLAQQSLQPDFDPDLVTLFDKQAQGTVAQSHCACRARASPCRSITSAGAGDPGATSASPFGFADLLLGRRRGAGGATGGDGRDGGRRQRRDRHRPAAPGRHGQSVDHLLPGRRPQRARSTACIRAMPAIRRPCRRRAYQHDDGRHVDRRAGLRQLRADRACSM